MYKVTVLNAEPCTQTEHMFDKKPTFQEIYPLINCDLIEILKGLDYNNKKIDLYCDEESKLKEPIKCNTIATDMWYKWLDRHGLICIPGDFIAGNVAIIKKVKKDV